MNTTTHLTYSASALNDCRNGKIKSISFPFCDALCVIRLLININCLFVSSVNRNCSSVLLIILNFMTAWSLFPRTVEVERLLLRNHTFVKVQSKRTRICFLTMLLTTYLRLRNRHQFSISVRSLFAGWFKEWVVLRLSYFLVYQGNFLTKSTNFKVIYQFIHIL